MNSALSEEIQAFKIMLPEIRQKCGSAWVVMVGSDLKESFKEFSKAAMFVADNFSDRQCLIRHTDDQQETIPFVAIES